MVYPGIPLALVCHLRRMAEPRSELIAADALGSNTDLISLREQLEIRDRIILDLARIAGLTEREINQSLVEMTKVSIATLQKSVERTHVTMYMQEFIIEELNRDPSKRAEKINDVYNIIDRSPGDAVVEAARVRGRILGELAASRGEKTVQIDRSSERGVFLTEYTIVDNPLTDDIERIRMDNEELVNKIEALVEGHTLPEISYVRRGLGCDR